MTTPAGFLPLPRSVFRYLCLLTALANGLGNVFLILFYRPVFKWLSVPLPQDVYSFLFVAGFSFTMGLLAFLVFLNPEESVDLLIVGAVGKGIYAFFTFYCYVFQGLHWFYLIFGVWDAVYTVIFLLFLISLVTPDLARINEGDIFVGVDRPRTNKAIILVFSLTGTGRSGAERIKAGLERQGYTVDMKFIEAEEEIFRFPMSFRDFARIVVRAIFRRPTRIKPLGISADHPYDLIIVESQTWLVGISAPVEAMFTDPANQGIFESRDVAILNVCRGAWRRSQAMLVRWAQSCGGNVVGARAFAHIGWEPSRLFSLWFYLIYKKAGEPKFLNGFVQPRYGISDEALDQLERFGEDLAGRKRVLWQKSTVM
ncbi:MAG: hypothetical protein HY913_21075 [Desulfomonile tiedjei]|nr:hypothetical protein [Desulfomonile tiedjei]